jgi:uncharacterized OB-fold protein
MPPDDRRPPAAIVDEAWREGRLVYQVDSADRALWPPRLAAPLTGEELSWRESAGLGSVYAATAIHARDAEPRSIVLVDLDDGFRMMSSVSGIAAEDVRVGMRVRVRFGEPDDDGTRLPLFEPADET